MINVVYPRWTPMEVDMLRALWTKKVPAARIGVLLGKSKNAVIGKADRLQLETRRPIKRKSSWL